MRTIKKLSNLLTPLKLKCLKSDNLTAQHKANKSLIDKPIFSRHLFRSQSDKFIAYYYEIEKEVKGLQQTINLGNNDISHQFIERIEQQITALYNAIGATQTRLTSGSLELTRKRNKRYQSAVKSLTENSHSLHQKLAEYRGFERRLSMMLDDKNSQHQQCKASVQTALSQELLTLHQRLGRCRQAISKVEKQIEMMEKTQQTSTYQ